MIAPLRRAHRWSWLVAALVLALVIASALASRQDANPWNGALDWENVR